MLLLKSLHITQFKNYDQAVFEFPERIMGICGLNGRGKTNLLDAVYYCCFTKSYFTRTDNMVTQFDKTGFRLEALFEKNNLSDKVICIHRGAGKKELTLNEVPYEKFSHHIGGFPVVMIAPDDIILITGGSEERRRFMDTVLCQLDADYLQDLIVYNKVLLQRNSLLKKFADPAFRDYALLEVLDTQLFGPGTSIHKKRNSFNEQLIPLVNEFYKRISGNKEQVSIQYESQLGENDFQTLLLQMREKDQVLQRTNGGIHKDELNFQLNGQSFKQTASQGQRKSLLFAIKLAELEILKTNKGFAPLLLLDDIFEKLDEGRMHELLNWVCCENEGQVLITDTHRERLEFALGNLDTSFKIIAL